MKIGLSALLVVVAFMAGRATSANIAYPGMTPYTPTKLEWIELQSWIAVKEDTIDATTGYGMTIDTVARAPESIVLTIRYMPNERRDVMNKIIENKKRIIRALAKGAKWDSWLKIEEDVAPIMGDQ
jgi:hypothetical protein